MTLRAFECRFTYSNALFPFATQGDPLISLGGIAPIESLPDDSAPYYQEALDANSTDPTIVNDTETNTPSSDDPAVDDWLMMLNGNAAFEFGKITAVNYGTGDITIDRALSALPSIGDDFRVSRAENLFPDVTAAQASSGLVDHRMLYFLKKTIGGENNHRFYILPVKPNGCDIEVYGGGDGATDVNAPVIASGTDDPFQQFGVVANINLDRLRWETAAKAEIRYTEDSSAPEEGSLAIQNNESVPIWIRRTVPAGVTSGECVFALIDFVPDAVAQDAGADPDPFHSGFIFSWNIPETTYAITITQDRTAYTRGSVRLTGTVVDALGSPVPNLNCWLELFSGPGSVNTDLDGRTDSAGKIFGVYTSPVSISTDPVIRLVIPTNPDF